MLRRLVRQLFLCIALGGHSILGVGMSQEKIEELLHAMHQTRVEVAVSDGSEATMPKQPARKTDESPG